MAEAKGPQNLTDPEVSSDFARSKKLAKEKGTAPGIDPETGERAAITYRQLYNETEGAEDGKVAERMFRDIARAGGYGDVELNQALDLRSLPRSVEDRKKAMDKGVDMKGEPLDLYGKHKLQQEIQHQDNLVNAVGEALERLKKG